LKHTHGPTGLMKNGHGHDIDNEHHTHTHSHSHSHGDEEQSVAMKHKSQNDHESVNSGTTGSYFEHNISSQIGGILFLEFGIIFHSVFVGLTLAVAGDEFKTLYIVLVFHQLFEGLGLGTRLATAP